MGYVCSIEEEQEAIQVLASIGYFDERLAVAGVDDLGVVDDLGDDDLAMEASAQASLCGSDFQYEGFGSEAELNAYDRWCDSLHGIAV